MVYEENKLILQILKDYSPINSVKIREIIENNYNIWQNEDKRNIEKRIRRRLEQLISFGIAKKERVGKKYLFSYIQESKKLQKLNQNSFYKNRKDMLNILNHHCYYIDYKEENIDNKEEIIK